MSATASTRPCSRGLAHRITYVPLDVAASEHWADLAAALAGGEDRPRLFYLATSPDLFGPICEGAGAAGIVTPHGAGGAGEADRPRPRLGDPHQRPGRPGVRRVPGLPDRPLSREGVGPEPAGAALRQFAVRGGLEPRPHRPCPDHRRRDRRRRGARGLLRQVGCLARHGAEPPAPAALPRRHGAADLDGRRFGARREAQGAALAAHHDRRRGLAEDRARPVPRRCRGRHGRAGLCRGAGRAQPDRDLRRDQGRGRQLALGRHAVLPAHRQAPADAGARRS